MTMALRRPDVAPWHLAGPSYFGMLFHDFGNPTVLRSTNSSTTKSGIMWIFSPAMDPEQPRSSAMNAPTTPARPFSSTKPQKALVQEHASLKAM